MHRKLDIQYIKIKDKYTKKGNMINILNLKMIKLK